jgi:hypothetical protein
METRRCGFGFLRQVKPRSPVGNTAQTCRCQRCGQLRRGDSVVDSADEFERQGYGRQAARLYFERARGYADPAVICRGPEYQRILYGPEYLLPRIWTCFARATWERIDFLSAASSRSALSRSRFSCSKNRCAGLTSAPLAFRHWRASSSIRTCEAGIFQRNVGKKRRPVIIHSQRDGSRDRFLPEHRRVYRYAGRGI